jgi:hypothetical protein
LSASEFASRNNFYDPAEEEFAFQVCVIIGSIAVSPSEARPEAYFCNLEGFLIRGPVLLSLAARLLLGVTL